MNLLRIPFIEYQNLYGGPEDEFDLPIEATEYVDGVLYVYPDLIP
jgi:hypothetical protein